MDRNDGGKKQKASVKRLDVIVENGSKALREEAKVGGSWMEKASSVARASAGYIHPTLDLPESHWLEL